MAGVTLITHGFQSDGVFPQWVSRMAEGVARRIEPDASAMFSNVSRYRLRIVQSGANPVVESFTRTAGPAPSSSTTGEAVIELDWAAASGLSGPSTGAVATTVLNALASPASALGFGSRGVFGLPIHLVGHSRGASLVADLARQMGQLGLAVDQLTTLDPFPLGNDPGPTRGVNVPDNVVYADNYYQNTDFFVYGGPVTGANNVGPLSLPGGASLAHSDIHTYYHGTIDRGDTTDGDVTINTAWYGTTLNRATTGFDATRISGGSLPSTGLSSLGGGNAARVHVDTTAAIPFPNAFPVSIGAPEFILPGNQLTFTTRYQLHTVSGEIDFYLDTDRNLTNGFSRAIATTGNVAMTGPTPSTAVESATWTLPSIGGVSGLAAGLYYLNGIITDGTAGHVRYFTYPQVLVVNGSGARLVNKQWSRDTDANDALDPRNYSPGGVPAAGDSVAYGFGRADAAGAIGAKSITTLSNATFSSTVSQSVPAIDVLGGSAFVMEASGANVLSTAALALSPNARLDLANNAMVIDYSGASPYPDVAAAVKRGFDNGTWNGRGIGSSFAVFPSRTIGYAESSRIASTFPTTVNGVSVDSTAIVLRYTIAGDANLDRKVDFDDLLSLAQGYGLPDRLYADGDTDFDNDVDFDDLLRLAQQYGTTLALDGTPRWNSRRVSRVGALL